MYSMSGNLSRLLLASPAALPNTIMSSLLDRRCGLTAQMNVLAAVEKKKKKAKLEFDYSQCLSLLYNKLLELQLQHNWIPDYMLYTIFGTTAWLDTINKIVQIQSYKLHLTFGTNVMFWMDDRRHGVIFCNFIWSKYHVVCFDGQGKILLQNESCISVASSER